MQISLRNKKVYPENDCPHEHVYVSEDTEKGKKILEGFDFEIVDREIQMEMTQKGKNYKFMKGLKEKLKNGNASMREMQKILFDLID